MPPYLPAVAQIITVILGICTLVAVIYGFCTAFNQFKLGIQRSDKGIAECQDRITQNHVEVSRAVKETHTELTTAVKELAALARDNREMGRDDVERLREAMEQGFSTMARERAEYAGLQQGIYAAVEARIRVLETEVTHWKSRVERLEDEVLQPVRSRKRDDAI